jgi:hypothetical protein
MKSKYLMIAGVFAILSSDAMASHDPRALTPLSDTQWNMLFGDWKNEAKAKLKGPAAAQMMKDFDKVHLICSDPKTDKSSAVYRAELGKTNVACLTFSSELYNKVSTLLGKELPKASPAPKQKGAPKAPPVPVQKKSLLGKTV